MLNFQDTYLLVQPPSTDRYAFEKCREVRSFTCAAKRLGCGTGSQGTQLLVLRRFRSSDHWKFVETAEEGGLLAVPHEALDARLVAQGLLVGVPVAAGDAPAGSTRDDRQAES